MEEEEGVEVGRAGEGQEGGVGALLRTSGAERGTEGEMKGIEGEAMQIVTGTQRRHL